ncbi:MAG: hypothetical protein IIA45_04285 [Bacteroidetes bacterium]|nr:hypothetical protein [Bacteroidota bacterium]
MPELEQYELLDLVSSFCKNKGILLKEFPLATIHKRGGYNLESSKIIVEGSYTQIVELVYELERKIRAGKIASLHFTKKIDRKSRLHYLNAVIHLQQVKTTNDESL